MTWDYDEDDPTLLYDHHVTSEIRDRAGCVPLKRRCLAELRQLAASTGAAVVLSTTWRVVPEQKQILLGTLRQETVLVHPDESTPSLRGSLGRGSEVAAWLAAHPEVNDYVIFDDDQEVPGPWRRPFLAWRDCVCSIETHWR